MMDGNSCLEPRFARMVQNLTEKIFPFHGTNRRFHIESPKSGSSDIEGRHSRVDRFQLRLNEPDEPSLRWWVILNAEEPDCPPDFIFDDPTFQPEYSDVKSLVDWQSGDERALIYVVEELLLHLREHEAEQLPETMRTAFRRCLGFDDVSREHTSFRLDPLNDTVTFFVSLRIGDQPGHVADIEYRQSLRDQNPVCDTSVNLSLDLRNAISDVERSRDASLLMAISRVKREVERKQKQAYQNLKLRSSVVEAVLEDLGDSLLEVDTETFRRFDVLTNFDGVFVKVSVELAQDLYNGGAKITATNIYKGLGDLFLESKTGGGPATSDEFKAQIVEEIKRNADYLAQQVLENIQGHS